MQDRQREGGRLAGTGLGNAHNIFAGKKFWNGPRLDRRRDEMFTCVQRTKYRFG